MMFDGILPVNKSRDVLSNSVVVKIKKIIKRSGIIVKVGHGGTLDKFASGLLLILIGKATKLFHEISVLDKSYEAVVKFGELRDTDDIYGRVIEYSSTSHLDRKVVENALKNFEGEILQIPPAYSSVHINGERAYKLAKKDYYSTLKMLRPRKVNVYEIKLLNFDKDNSEATIFVRCSGGTYIRSIARDLGYKLGAVAFLKALTRKSIGGISLDRAITDDLINSPQDIERNLISIEEFRKIFDFYSSAT
ncbi:MAG: tRNA pseudouridine(55) synthase TruB [Spirochaetia bacterium]|nr:tRNA pseudouridine(55) synthase TruB [Spirochaetota bacterium]MCX8096660.1 tRNA pseudouridine(55) synthase TruB [Spirochaetota bacterium]MDW8112491.1 tRNA pseudouridine(55) synthase TruB [Spirochaetia bacterium]